MAKALPPLSGAFESPLITTTGFLIGDGTGVGKGRELAAIIWESWLRSRKRAAWFTCICAVFAVSSLLLCSTLPLCEYSFPLLCTYEHEPQRDVLMIARDMDSWNPRAHEFINPSQALDWPIIISMPLGPAENKIREFKDTFTRIATERSW